LGLLLQAIVGVFEVLSEVPDISARLEFSLSLRRRKVEICVLNKTAVEESPSAV
jgi:hypothetical protein